jgi:hypothetical protein
MNIRRDPALSLLCVARYCIDAVKPPVSNDIKQVTMQGVTATVLITSVTHESYGSHDLEIYELINERDSRDI